MDGAGARLSACFINCSLKAEPEASHTARLIHRAASIMETEGATVDLIHAREHRIAFGMAKDLRSETVDDDWPDVQRRIMAADIVVLGTPIWLGVKSSVANLVVERMYAYSGDTNDRGQYLYYGKVGGCVVTGNEDGVKACAMEILYALQHLGFTIPPQADCGWIGEIGPGPSYGDDADDSSPVGYDNDFTNMNATIMAWNLMHIAAVLRRADGIPATGNTPGGWRSATNATQFPAP
jgi:multimeric flavodoxin WrbA